MQVTVNRNEFRKAILTAGGVVQRRNTVPILGHVLLSTELDSLTVTGTNMDVTARVRMELESVPVSGMATVEKARLAKVLDAMQCPLLDLETVTLSDDEPGAAHALRITASGGDDEMAVTLPCLDPADYPEEPPLCEGKDRHGNAMETSAAEIGCGVLAHAFGRVQFAISREETRYYLNGIHLHVYEAGRLAAVATDGHRLARQVFNAPCDWLTESVIVPRECIDHLLPLLKTDGDELATVLLAKNGQRMEFAAGNWRITTKLIDGTFPDYVRVIPQRVEKPTQVDRARTLRAMRLMAAVGPAKSSASARLAFDGTRLTINGGATADGTESMAAVPCVHTGKPFTIGFNARYLRDLLERCGGDAVALHMSDPAGPSIVEDAGDPDFTGILMPMRV